jgi:hypothetical protein
MHPDIDCLFWQLDTKGHVLHKEFIAKMPSLEPPRVTIIPLPAPQEGAIIIGAFEDNFGWSLLRVDNTGRVVKSTKLVNEPAAFLSAVLLPNAKGILLVGQYGFQGSVWKIDLDGKVSWRKTYEYKAKADDKKEKAGDDEAKARKKTNTAFYGLALTDDQGDFIVAGDHGDIEKLGLGPRSVWLVCCDAEGVVASEEAFPGRYPSICAVDGNRFAVLYGAQTEMSIDSHVRVVDIQLKQQWDKKVELTSVWVDRPAISNIPSV